MAFVRTTKTWPANNGNVPPWQRFAIGVNICIRIAIYVLAKEKKWFGNGRLAYAKPARWFTPIQSPCFFRPLTVALLIP